MHRNAVVKMLLGFTLAICVVNLMARAQVTARRTGNGGVRLPRLAHSAKAAAAANKRYVAKMNHNLPAASRRPNGGKKHIVRKGPLQSALDKINLTSEQRNQIEVLSQKANTDGKAAYADRSLTPDQYHERMAQINAEHRKAIADVLTPEQRTRFESLLSGSKK